MTTYVCVERVGGRHVARVGGRLIRPQLLRADERGCRIGLLATHALLLGGDEVELDVTVGAGATLDLFDVAGTVAYHGRGEASAWRVGIRLGEQARLRYAGEPFVVADGAHVTRDLTLDADEGASVAIRDTVVLGRAGQVGGRLRSRTRIVSNGREVLVEDQHLDPATRTDPGMLGPHRVLDSVFRIGAEITGPSEATTYALVGGVGTVIRWLGSSLAESPVHRDWAEVVRPLAV